MAAAAQAVAAVDLLAEAGSSYYGAVTNPVAKAGNTSFTSPTGSNETGHTGNGYARITVVD